MEDSAGNIVCRQCGKAKSEPEEKRLEYPRKEAQLESYEIRELSEDRIIRRSAIYKDLGVPAPVYERQIESVAAVPAEVRGNY